MKNQTVAKALLFASTVFMLEFLYLFVSRNAPGLAGLPVTVLLAAIYGLVYLAVVFRLFRRPNNPGTSLIPAGIVLMASALLVFVFLEATVLDYYQPLSLYDEAIGALALWWGLLILAGIYSLIAARVMLRPLAGTFLLALASWPLAASLWWINSPEPGNGVAANDHVFVGGEGGYDTYRIPGFTLIPAGSTLASGEVLSADRLLAFVEARRDGALDIGVIDLALKISDDGGVNWSQQVIICRHLVGQHRGKCGNPTPVFDRVSGSLILAYNLSGLEVDDRQHSSHIMVSEDGGLNWGGARYLADDNFVFGPGKGIQKVLPPHSGRLFLPGHADGIAYLLYSDDHGATWQRSAGVAGANETDVAERKNGSLYLATRHPVPISRAPEPNGRLFSISPDGANNWSSLQVNEQLPTPVCQVSVISGRDGSLLFSNPAHHRSRVRMTVRQSRDSGATWDPGLLIYPGPSGYSVLAEGSDGSVYLLYENGNMAYSERISLARLGPVPTQ